VLSAAVAALRALEPGLDPALARQVRDALSALSASRKEFP